MYVVGEILRWKVYDLDRLGYFRIMKKIISLGYMNNFKIYWLPRGSALENGLKFMYNDDFIHDMLEVSSMFDVFHMDLYVEHAIDEPEIIEGPRLLSDKMIISSDEEMGEVDADNVEESEIEGGGDVCDLTEAEHFIEGQSRVVNVELMESDEINVDVSRGCTSSNVQILNENKVSERGHAEGGFNAAGIHKGKDSTYINILFHHSPLTQH